MFKDIRFFFWWHPSRIRTGEKSNLVISSIIPRGKRRREEEKVTIKMRRSRANEKINKKVVIAVIFYCFICLKCLCYLCEWNNNDKYNLSIIDPQSSFLNRLKLLRMLTAYTETMHWIVSFVLCSAFPAFYFGHVITILWSNPVSQKLLFDIITLAPFLCMIRVFNKNLKGLGCSTNFSITASLISLIQMGTIFSS